MASTLLPPARSRRGERPLPAFTLQAFPFSGLVGMALLAVAVVTTATVRVADVLGPPDVEIVAPTGGLPPVAAAAYVVVDADDGRHLASFNADDTRPTGSLVKLMTARLVLAAGAPDRTVTVPGLDLAGPNPDGPDSTRQLSSAHDVAVLARDLLGDPDLRRAARRPSTVVGGERPAATNDLLTAYPSADGVKTGPTDGAGWCLAASATRDGRRMLVVVLGAPTEQARDSGARALLDHAFAA